MNSQLQVTNMPKIKHIRLFVEAVDNNQLQYTLEEILIEDVIMKTALKFNFDYAN